MRIARFFLEGDVMRGGGWLALEKVVLLIKGLILAYCFANWLPREVYGAYQFIVASLATLSLFVLPGMGVAIVQALARNHGGTFGRAIKLAFFLGFLGSLLLLLVSAYYWVLESLHLSIIFFMLAWIFPAYAIRDYWRYYYTGYSEFSHLFRTSIVLEVLSLFFILIPLLYFPMDVSWLVLFGIIIPLPFSLLILWKMYRSSIKLPIDEDNIQFGKKISYALSLSSIATYGDKLLLGHFLGFTDVAIYSVASIIPEQARSAITSFMTPLLPRYSSQNSENVIKKHLLWFGMISLLTFGILYPIVPYVFQFFFSQYLEGIQYTQWLLLSLLFIPGILLETLFRSQKSDRIVLKATLIGSGIGILFLLFLVPSMGIIGVVIAKILSLAFQSGTYIYHFLNQRNKKIYSNVTL